MSWIYSFIHSSLIHNLSNIFNSCWTDGRSVHISAPCTHSFTLQGNLELTVHLQKCFQDFNVFLAVQWKFSFVFLCVYYLFLTYIIVCYWWCGVVFFHPSIMRLKLCLALFSSPDIGWWTQTGSSTPKLSTSTWPHGSVMTRWPMQLLRLTFVLILQNGSMTAPTPSPSAGSLVSNTLVLIHVCSSL